MIDVTGYEPSTTGRHRPRRAAVDVKDWVAAQGARLEQLGGRGESR